MTPRPGEITSYADPNGGISAPTGIIMAPDGDAWFTSIGNHRVGRVRASSGTVETFIDPLDRVRLPANIIPAADGRLWFTCLGSNMLASIDPTSPKPAATLTHHAHPDLDKPVAIKSGIDGRLWFSLRGGEGAVGSLDPTAPDPLATLEVYRSPHISGPSALFADSHGSVWWVNGTGHTVGRLRVSDLSGEVEIESFAGFAGAPRAWAVASDGTLWITLRDPAGLQQLNPTATDPLAGTRTVTDTEDLVSPDGIWLGGDGALWIADTEVDRIVRFDPGPVSNPFSRFGCAPEVAGPFDIKGDGGALLWFTNKRGNTIASIVCR